METLAAVQIKPKSGNKGKDDVLCKVTGRERAHGESGRYLSRQLTAF